MSKDKIMKKKQINYKKASKENEGKNIIYQKANKKFDLTHVL